MKKSWASFLGVWRNHASLGTQCMSFINKLKEFRSQNIQTWLLSPGSGTKTIHLHCWPSGTAWKPWKYKKLILVWSFLIGWILLNSSYLDAARFASYISKSSLRNDCSFCPFPTCKSGQSRQTGRQTCARLIILTPGCWCSFRQKSVLNRIFPSEFHWTIEVWIKTNLLQC